MPQFVSAQPGKPANRAPQFKDVATQSVYLPMRDGVPLAVDVMLPKDRPATLRLPAILIIARYWRSFAMRMPWPPTRAPLGPRDPLPDFLVAQGYAVVGVDVRGSGASGGSSAYPWNEAEIADYGEVAEWIIRQPWSSGVVGAIGISYEGTTAELLAAAHPTATKAVIPQEVELDLFTGITFPGGILNDYFMKTWQHTNADLDQNRVPGEWGPAKIFLKGVRPVDADRDRAQLDRAVADHRLNVDVCAAIKNVVYRDDRYGALDVTIDDFSPLRYREQIERSGVPIFGWGSWLDGATAEAVLQRFVTFSNPQWAVIGAWDHRYKRHASPFVGSKAPVNPPLTEVWQAALEYFDHYLKSTPGPEFDAKQLFYYTLGEEQWKVTDVWPPAGMIRQRWYLAQDKTLSLQPPAEENGSDTYHVDFAATTGKKNRWHTSDGMTAVNYPDRARSDRRLLTYTSAPLTHDLEITGHAIVTLYVTSTADDGAVYVYLEDVDEAGKVSYVTEGQLRAIHRRVVAEAPAHHLAGPYHSFKRADSWPLTPGEVAELSFALQPTSVLIKPGHRLRVAIAGHDCDTFARVPAEGTPTIVVQRNRVQASHIDLPLIPR